VSLRLHLLIGESDGKPEVIAMVSAAELDEDPERWTSEIEAARAGVASTHPMTITRFGVVQVELGDEQIAAAYARAARPRRAAA